MRSIMDGTDKTLQKKTTETPQVQNNDNVVVVLNVQVFQVPEVQLVEKTIEFPQLLAVEKIGEGLEIQRVSNTPPYS